MRISTPKGAQAKQIGIVNAPGVAGLFLPSYLFQSISAEEEGLVPQGSQVSVNGHSLGGALASTFANLFNGSSVAVDDVETFNSAGYGAWAPAFFAQVKALLPVGNNFYGYTDENYFADNGLSVTTREFANSHLGTRIPLSQEESTLAIWENHSMYKITDMLAFG